MDCELIGWCALKPEVQAAWAQAVLSVAAILAAERFASRRDRRELSRKTQVYVDLISMAEVAAQSIPVLPRRGDLAAARQQWVTNYQIRDFEQFAEAFRAISLQDVPDYRLLPAIRDAADACGVLVETMRNIEALAQAPIGEAAQACAAAIRQSQVRLETCYERAAEVGNEYSMPSLTQRWNRLRLWFRLQGRKDPQ